jgi:hypothetical protein
MTRDWFIHSFMTKMRDEFLMREPLLLQRHLNMPVRSICFDGSEICCAMGYRDRNRVF